MKKKKLALLLAVAMSVTSIDSTAMMVNAADFTSEEMQEQGVELTDEPSEATVETDAETEDGGVLSENSSEDESIEITDESQESADTGGEDTGIDIQEEASPEDVFSAGDEIAVPDDEVSLYRQRMFFWMVLRESHFIHLLIWRLHIQAEEIP